MTVSKKLLPLTAILSSIICLSGTTAGQDSQLVTYHETSPPANKSILSRPSWLKLPVIKAPTTTVAMPNISESFEKLGQGTQRIARQTKQALTPRKPPSLHLPTLKLPKMQRPAKGPSLFSSLFKKRSPPRAKQPETIHDWLGLPRP